MIGASLKAYYALDLQNLRYHVTDAVLRLHLLTEEADIELTRFDFPMREVRLLDLSKMWVQDNILDSRDWPVRYPARMDRAVVIRE